MKKLLALIMVLCMAVIGSTGGVSASANSGITPQTVGISPFSSEVISSISSSISKTNVSAMIMLTKSYSGTVTITLQKQSGSWSSHLTVCSGDSFSGATISKSKSVSITSGTYRLAVTVTTGGTSYTSYSGAVTI